MKRSRRRFHPFNAWAKTYRDLTKRRRDGVQQRSRIIICGQFPDHHPAEPVGEDVAGLRSQRLRIFVADHDSRVGAIEPGRLRLVVPAPHVGGEVIVLDIPVPKLPLGAAPGRSQVPGAGPVAV